MLTRMLRTIVHMITDPYRPVGWKILDCLLVSSALALGVIGLVSWNFDWFFLYILVVPVIYLLTQSKWWQMRGMPSTPRPHFDPGLAIAAPPVPLQQVIPDEGRAKHETWDPMALGRQPRA